MYDSLKDGMPQARSGPLESIPRMLCANAVVQDALHLPIGLTGEEVGESLGYRLMRVVHSVIVSRASCEVLAQRREAACAFANVEERVECSATWWRRN